jgi:hypothetical protein
MALCFPPGREEFFHRKEFQTSRGRWNIDSEIPPGPRCKFILVFTGRKKQYCENSQRENVFYHIRNLGEFYFYPFNSTPVGRFYNEFKLIKNYLFIFAGYPSRYFKNKPGQGIRFFFLLKEDFRINV